MIKYTSYIKVKMGNVESEMLETYQEKFEKLKTNITILEYQHKKNIVGSAFIAQDPADTEVELSDIDNYEIDLYELISTLAVNDDESLEKTKLLFEMIKFFMNKFPNSEHEEFIQQTLIKLRSYN